MKRKILFLKVLFMLKLAILLPSISFAQGMWTQKATLSGGQRVYGASFSIGTKGYIGMGISGTDVELRDFWEWDQTTNIWTRKADYPGNSSSDMVCFSIGTKGYVGTGSSFNSSGSTNDFWEYDPATNNWTQKASLPTTPARYWAVGFSIGTKGYIGLGYPDPDNGIPYKDFWEWDQATNVWTKKADFEGMNEGAAVGFSIGNKGYLGTGISNNGSSLTTDFWEWDQATNIWTKKTNFGGIGRALAVAFSIGNKGYLGTGADINNDAIKDFWEWDQVTNVWTEKASFGVARGAAIGFSIGNKGYLGTGADVDFNVLSDFGEYDPFLTTGIAVLAQEDISMYPNPTSGKFTIKNVGSEMTNPRLEIYNVFGEMIYSDAKLKQQTANEIDLSSAPKGIYFVNIYDGGKFYKGKIVIK